MSRRLRLLFTALAVAALLWLLLVAAERALALAQRFMALPTWLQWTLGGVLAISVGGSERYQRQLADGSTETVERQRKPAIKPLLKVLEQLPAPGADGLEGLREHAVLAGVHQRTGNLEARTRAADAEQIVRKYARRAVVGALAAVAPGSDW